jgi:hypothetical protein
MFFDHSIHFFQVNFFLLTAHPKQVGILAKKGEVPAKQPQTKAASQAGEIKSHRELLKLYQL